MKKYLKYIAIIAVLVSFGACKKNSFREDESYVGISKITYFPNFTVKGDQLLTVPKGTAFVDPGVTAKGGSADLPVTINGTVDVNTAGVYTLTYTATNVDNFSATTSRTVVVYDTDASAADNDFSGSYARTSNGQLAVWTKIAPGVYTIMNPGGAIGATLTVVAFNQRNYEFFIPHQIAGGNPSSSSAESTVPGSTPGTLASYKMRFVNPGYGSSIRSFVKQ